MRSSMLCRERSSEANMKMARTSAFLDSLAAKFRGKFGELMLLRIWRYRERTRPLFRAKSSAVAHIAPLISFDPRPPVNRRDWCCRLAAADEEGLLHTSQCTLHN
ncbi:hypothetical protein M0R45_035437 [Rubus argutus]|uniref:Uncharacterized protein n=1 Tax=Rubus argutus TaxID=59490 RepID=A0AAW1VU88_RUBAR